MGLRSGRRGAVVLGACLALACAGSEAPAPPSPSPGSAPARPRSGYPARVVLVSVTGFTPAAYRVAPGHEPLMATVSTLAGSGAAADAVTGVTPTTPYPSHATLVTGELPSVHGIVADHLLGDRGVRAARLSHASLLKAPTLWDLATRSGLAVASLDWPTTVGAAVDWLLPDLTPTARGETWAGVLADATTPGLLERARGLGLADAAADRAGSARDSILAGLACELLASERPPGLTLIRLSQAAPEFLRAGPDAPAVSDALQRVDREIGGLLTCLAQAGRVDSTAIGVVGDVGVLPVHTLIAPNAVLAGAGLLSAEGPGVSEWSAVVRSNGGSAFLYARNDAAAVRARRELTDAAARTRAFQIVSAEQMLELGADPEAWFGLEAEPGFAFGDQAVRPLLQPAAQLGAAGYLPGRTAPDTGFVLWGQGVRPGVRIPTMRQTDIAPTIARLLRLDLGSVDGRPLVGALALPEAPERRPVAERHGGR